MTDINRHRGLAIASLILGGISCFCCFGTGIGVIPAAIALVFSIIAVAKGGKNAKKLGIIGLILSAIGLVLNAVILAYGIWMIRWDHMTIENLSSIQNLNPANEKDIIEWLQQFIKVDISGMVNLVGGALLFLPNYWNPINGIPPIICCPALIPWLILCM